MAVGCVPEDEANLSFVKGPKVAADHLRIEELRKQFPSEDDKALKARLKRDQKKSKSSQDPEEEELDDEEEHEEELDADQDLF